MEMPLCKNCDNPAENSFCSHCGQKTNIPRITFHNIWHEVLHYFTHLEKGFLFTSWKMLVSPGDAITSYIHGRRKYYHPPVAYLLIWTTAFILTLYLFEKLWGENTVITYNEYFGPGASTRYAISHLSFMLMFIIPFQTFYLYILITRQRYNYFETLVAAIYAVGTIILLQFVFALIALLYSLTTGIAFDLRYSDIFKFGYFVWFTIHMLKEIENRHQWLRGILFVVLASGTFTVWRIFVVPEMANLFMK